MSAYVELRDALFDLVNGLDITSAFPVELDEEDATWRVALKRPPKSDELQDYPAFAILPYRDQRVTGDTEIDLTAYVFLIRLYVGWNEADESEDQIHTIVQIVRQALMNERTHPVALEPFCYGMTFSGMWSGDETQGERIFQLEVTCQVDESAEAI